MPPSPQDLLKKVQGGTASAPLSFSTPASSIPSPKDLLAKSDTSLIDQGKGFVSFLGSKIKGAANAVADFGKSIGNEFVQASNDKVLVSPLDAAHGLLDTVVSTAKAINTGAVRASKSVADMLRIPTPSGNTVNSFVKTITGEEKPIGTYQDIYHTKVSEAAAGGATPSQAALYGGAFALGTAFFDDPIGFGSFDKAALKLTEESAAKIAATQDAAEIARMVSLDNPGISKKGADAVGSLLVHANTPEEVKVAVNQLTNKETLKAGSDIPNPDEVLTRAKNNLEVPPAAVEPGALPYYRALEDADQKTTKFAPVDGEPVKILDGLETFVHRPENGAYEVMEASTGRMIGKPGASADEAIQSAKEALNGRTLEDVQMSIQKHDLAPRDTLTPETSPGAPLPFNRDLVRSISNEELPGPIVDTLKREFPHLSDNALAPIAGRLARLKRTGDIEGILQVVRNINSDIARSRAGIARTGKGPIIVSKDTIDKSIAKVGERKAAGDLPASIGELLTAAERGRYLDNVSSVIKDKESAVLAQQEYDALWEHADQRVIDRYEELKTLRDALRGILGEHTGRELNNLYKGTFVSPQDVELDELIHVRKKGTDQLIDEITGRTGGDIQDAQKELNAFYSMRDQLLEVEQELRTIRPKARAARILQTMVEDVPIISRHHAGIIESLATPENVRGYKDISGFMGQARDVYRNFEAVFGDKFKEVKRIILDPFDKSKGDFASEVKSLGDRIEENIIKKYDIQRGSKESAAIQLYGEGKISHEELIKMVGPDKVDDIINASAWFRKEYDRLLDEVNAVRAKIFPNDPNKLIPKRSDYFRHFEEMSDGFRSLISIFETPTGIDPALAGLSEWTKPKSKFLPFAQERLGDHTAVDAVGGFLNYAPTFAYAKHIDQHIGNFRYLRRTLADVAPTPGVREIVPVANEQAAAMGATDLVKQPGINNFLEYLDHFANDLAGKTNPMDRYLQTLVPGGRKTFKVINWINSRVKANAILGNLSSAVAQIFNVPQGIASAKLYSLPGISRTLSSIVAENGPMKESSFIRERFKDDLQSRFKLDWVEHPIIGSVDRAKDVAVWITQAMDEVGTKFIWNSHYEKALAEGMPDPVKYADDITRQMVAGRGIGEVPLIQKSKVLQLVAPFQVEVQNAWYALGGFVKRKDFGAVATLLIANYLMNRAAEAVRGSPVVFDPIQSLIDGATQASDEMEVNGNAGRAAFKFVGRQVGELLSNVLGGQTIASAIPDAWVQGLTEKATGAPIDKKEIFGSADPGRFGGGLLSISGITDPLYRLLPPFGGQQAKRTLEGVESMLTGEVKDSKGQLSFKTTPTVKNVIQSTLFGKNATAEAQAFYETRSDAFNRQYSYDAARTADSIEAEKYWADVKQLPRDQAIAQLQELEKSNPLLAKAVAGVAQSEAQGLDGVERLMQKQGIDTGERAKFITDQLEKLGSSEEKIKYLQNLDEKKLITPKVADQIKAILAGPKSMPSVSTGVHSTSGILNTVITYADALGTDPVTAFNRIFTGQTIRRIDNGTIIVERMPLSASEAEKKLQAGTNGVNGMNLDHTIPLELGGSNAKNNLKLVSEATWASYTPVENFLGQALRSKKITKQKAQDLITRFKSGELTSAEVFAQAGK